MSPELRWLATYVALSRPQSFEDLLSVGMPANFRQILEGGPPEGILTKFAEFFAEQELSTMEMANTLLQQLGWTDS